MRNKYVTELDNDYYMWLCELVRAGENGGNGDKHGERRRTYWNLCTALYCKEFSWSVPNDDNRAFEGKNLREKFCEENGIEYIVDQFPEEVSMLELVIGLAYRCETIMDGSDSERPMSDWFWKIMRNAGLDAFDDGNFDTMDDSEVDEILDRIIERTYQRNGVGGLFPLKRDKK
jgi:hypothetical protein